VLAGKVAGRSVVLPIGGRNVDARLHERIVERDVEFPHRVLHAA
jgi:hypothetical protein